MGDVVGKNIRAHRERLAWTQEQLAAAAEVSVRTVQRAEEGHPIGAESLQSIAAALDVGVELLKTNLEDPAFQEAMRRAQSRFVFIHLRPIARATEFRPFFPADAQQLDSVDAINEDAGDAIARLEQSLKDLGDLWRDLEPVQRHEALKELQVDIDKLTSLGMVITAGADTMRLKSQQSDIVFSLSVLRVVVAPAAQPKTFAVRDKTASVSFA